MVRGDASVRGLVIGDDVTVTGKVAEGYSSSTAANTAVIDATVTTKHGKAAVPAATVLTTKGFESEVVRDGATDAEKWEGMLVRFTNLTVTTTNADAAAGSNFGEFGVNDGTGMMRVDDFGTWKTVYTTDSTKTTLTFLKVGTRIAALNGVMFFSFGNYKLEPRGASDFEGVVASVEQVSAVPSDLKLHSAYPNPISIASTQAARVAFDLARRGDVKITLHDVLGREMAGITHGVFDAGSYTASFDIAALPAGVYFVRMAAAGSVQSTRLVVTR
jgi:predicted extracellular nuclease